MAEVKMTQRTRASRRRLRVLALTGILASLTGSNGSLASHVEDHPWSGPPAILISKMKHTPRYMYHTTNVVNGDGRLVAFYRSRKDDPAKLLIRNVAREHNRLIARPHEGYRWNDYSYGKVRAWGYKPPDFTPDGRYLVFATEYRLLGRDRNRYADVYRYDRKTKGYELVSVGLDLRPADSESVAPTISDDGRYVAFTSGATDIVPNDTNHASDVFVRDLELGITERASVSSDGSQAGGPTHRSPSFGGSISGDGTRVAFISYGNDLVPDDTNRAPDAFVRDRNDGTTWRVSVTSSGEQLEPFEYCESASCYRDGVDQVDLSGNGEVVAFVSHANGLVEDDHNDNVDIFTHDIPTGVTDRVSEGTGGVEAYGEDARSCGNDGQCFGFIMSSDPSISYDGDRVFFLSGAPHMTDVDDDRDDDTDAFVHDRSSRITQLVNRRPDGSYAPGHNMYPGQISSNGAWVVYSTDARRIAPGDREAGSDIFLQGLDDAAFGD
ncbi:MAG TPA: hypothetical protein VFS18_00905 [Actinomycetota bacterium]|nr:hypothetical protein [Actinomycetota bacterium]